MLIAKGKFGQLIEKRKMPCEAAEHLRCIILNGIGKGLYTDMRHLLLIYGTLLPPYHVLVKFGEEYRYPLYKCFSGWRGKFPEIVEVSDKGLNFMDFITMTHKLFTFSAQN